MLDKEHLYDAFGEMLYLVAMADGEIQEEERQLLHKVAEAHPWGQAIAWSFNYEARKNNDLEDLYKKVIDTCHQYGPSEEYALLLDLMQQLAEAYDGVDTTEQKAIQRFNHELLGRFRSDIKTLTV